MSYDDMASDEPSGHLSLECPELADLKVGHVVTITMQAKITTLSDTGMHSLEVINHELKGSDNAYDAAHSAADELPPIVRSGMEPAIG